MMMFRPGKIILEWDALGQLKIAAPVDDKITCGIMLGHATAEIMKAGQDVKIPKLDSLKLAKGT